MVFLPELINYVAFCNGFDGVDINDNRIMRFNGINQSYMELDKANLDSILARIKTTMLGIYTYLFILAIIFDINQKGSNKEIPNYYNDQITLTFSKNPKHYLYLVANSLINTICSYMEIMPVDEDSAICLLYYDEEYDILINNYQNHRCDIKSGNCGSNNDFDGNKKCNLETLISYIMPVIEFMSPKHRKMAKFHILWWILNLKWKKIASDENVEMLLSIITSDADKNTILGMYDFAAYQFCYRFKSTKSNFSLLKEKLLLDFELYQFMKKFLPPEIYSEFEKFTKNILKTTAYIVKKCDLDDNESLKHIEDTLESYKYITDVYFEGTYVEYFEIIIKKLLVLLSDDFCQLCAKIIHISPETEKMCIIFRKFAKIEIQSRDSYYWNILERLAFNINSNAILSGQYCLIKEVLEITYNICKSSAYNNEPDNFEKISQVSNIIFLIFFRLIEIDITLKNPGQDMNNYKKLDLIIKHLEDSKFDVLNITTTDYDPKKSKPGNDFKHRITASEIMGFILQFNKLSNGKSILIIERIVLQAMLLRLDLTTRISDVIQNNAYKYLFSDFNVYEYYLNFMDNLKNSDLSKIVYLNRINAYESVNRHTEEVIKSRGPVYVTLNRIIRVIFILNIFKSKLEIVEQKGHIQTLIDEIKDNISNFPDRFCKFKLTDLNLFNDLMAELSSIKTESYSEALPNQGERKTFCFENLIFICIELHNILCNNQKSGIAMSIMYRVVDFSIIHTDLIESGHSLLIKKMNDTIDSNYNMYYAPKLDESKIKCGMFNFLLHQFIIYIDMELASDFPIEESISVANKELDNLPKEIPNFKLRYTLSDKEKECTNYVINLTTHLLSFSVGFKKRINLFFHAVMQRFIQTEKYNDCGTEICYVTIYMKTNDIFILYPNIQNFDEILSKHVNNCSSVSNFHLLGSIFKVWYEVNAEKNLHFEYKDSLSFKAAENICAKNESEYNQFFTSYWKKK